MKMVKTAKSKEMYQRGVEGASGGRGSSRQGRGRQEVQGYMLRRAEGVENGRMDAQPIQLSSQHTF